MVATSDLIKRAQKLAIDNSPTILTALGVTGAVTTAFLTGKATVKAVHILDSLDKVEEGGEWVERNNKDKFVLVWKEYIPAVGMLVLSVTCIIGANRIGTRRAAAVAAAYKLSEQAFVEYKTKVIDKLGNNKEREIRDEIAQDRVDRNPVSDSTVVVVGGADVLCFEAYTGRYFMSNMETLKKAQNDVNYMVINNMYASLSEFYSRVGLPTTDISDNVGWNCDSMMELEFSATVADDGRPAIVVTFHVAPVAGYARLH